MTWNTFSLSFFTCVYFSISLDVRLLRDQSVMWSSVATSNQTHDCREWLREATSKEASVSILYRRSQLGNNHNNNMNIIIQQFMISLFKARLGLRFEYKCKSKFKLKLKLKHVPSWTRQIVAVEQVVCQCMHNITIFE